MDFDLFKWFVGVVLIVGVPLVGFLYRDIRSEIKGIWVNMSAVKDKSNDKINDVETRLEAHRLYAAETFATKIDVEKGFDRVIEKLEAIDGKLDSKVSRHELHHIQKP